MKKSVKGQRWYHDWIDAEYDGALRVDWLKVLAAMWAVVATAFVFSVTFLLTADAVFARRAWAASVACKSQRMEAVRKPLTSEVVCVPAYRGTRNDTLTVGVPRGR